MIELVNVGKNYGKTSVLKDISFSFQDEKVYGIVGKNGIGKTTLLKQIAQVANPTFGEIVQEKNQRIGCSFGNDYYEELSIWQNLMLRKKVLGVEEDKTTTWMMKKVGLWEEKSKKVRELSLGMKQMLDLSLAFIGNPELMVLDEPFNGLDPMNVIIMRELIQEYVKREKCLVIISSHDLAGLEKLATEIIMLNDGQIIETLSIKELEEGISLEDVFRDKMLEGEI